MTDDDLFEKIGDAYLPLIHLGDGVDEAVATISRLADSVPSKTIGELLRDGDSWRERLVALVLASCDGIDKHYDDLIRGLHTTGGISIVPIFAATSVAIGDFACTYDLKMTDSLERDAWDGEIGFALDWLHYTIGIGDAPNDAEGPNYGQNFSNHQSFYATLSAA